ncbi:FHA domain-containing protein [bacterium]|nr:FHA domain-containing protein [bacterium]
MSNDAQFSPIKKLANLIKGNVVQPKIAQPIQTSNLAGQKISSIFTQKQDTTPTISFSSEEDKEIMQNVFNSIDENENGIFETEELSYLSSFSDDEDDGKEITQQDIILFIEEAKKEKETEALQEVLNSYASGVDKLLEQYYPNTPIEKLSDSEIEKAIFVDSMISQTQGRQAAINAYYDTEGLIDHSYNWIKELFDSGLTREDIDEYLANEQKVNEMLTNALANGGSLNVVEGEAGEGEISQDMIQTTISDRLSGFETQYEMFEYAQNYLGMDEEDLIPLIRTSLINSPFLANMDESNPELGRVIYDEEIGDYRVFINEDDDEGILLSDEYFTKFDHYNETYLEELNKNITENYMENTDDSVSFEKLYSFFTGVEYNPEAIQTANEATILMQHVSGLQQAAQYQEELFANATNPIDIFNYYKNICGYDNSQAAQAFNEYFDTMLSYKNEEGDALQVGNGLLGITCTSYHISEDAQSVFEEYEAIEGLAVDKETLEEYGYIYNKETGKYIRTVSLTRTGQEGEQEYIRDSLSLDPKSSFGIFFAINNSVDEEDINLNSTIQSFNEQYGENAFQDVIDNYFESTQAAYGNNVLNAKFEEYQLDMDSYSQNISNAIASAGFMLSFVNPAFGLVALGGAYTDNAIDLVNLATNNTDGEIDEWMLSTLKDVAYTTVGFKLGGSANKFGEKLLSKLLSRGTNQAFSVGASKAGEYALDVMSGAGFDSLTSYLETGNFNLKGNLLSNLVFGAADFKGGVGLYKAIKAGDIDVNVKFNTSDHNTFKGSAKETSGMEAGAPYAGYANGIMAQNNVFQRRAIRPQETNFSRNQSIPRNTEIPIQGFEVFNLKGYELDLSTPENRTMLINMKAGDTIKIGRSSNCQIRIPNQYEGASREHLTIKKNENGYTLIDTSSNGTIYINSNQPNFNPLVIKHRDGTKTEYINISSKTYDKLFPTTDGSIHSNSKQDSNGDCYLLSSINALFENPISRGTIIKCFNEKPDGTVSVKLPNGEMEFDCNLAMQRIERNPEQYSQTSLGLKLLEYAYEEERYNTAIKLSFKNQNPSSSTFAKYVHDRITYYNKKGNPITQFPSTQDKIDFRAGGWEEEVMSMFGYKTTYYNASDAKKAFKNLEGQWGEYVFTINTKQTAGGGGDDTFHDKKLDLAGSHSYMLIPKKNAKGGTEFILKNPWHSEEVSCVLSMKELMRLKYFDRIGITKIKR